MQPGLDHREVAAEAVQILAGKHPAYTGDAKSEASAFLQKLGRDFHGASAFADDLEANSADFAEVLNVSKESVQWIAGEVRTGIVNPARRSRPR